MICNKCGAENENGSKFCSSCGDLTCIDNGNAYTVDEKVTYIYGDIRYSTPVFEPYYHDGY